VKLIVRRRVRSALRGFTIPEIYESAAFDDRRERERLEAVAKSGTPLRLHVGCGPRVLAGWVNIDLAYQPFANYLEAYGEDRDGVESRGTREDFFAIDLTRGLPLPDGSVELVFHEDFIEHLSQRDAIGFLAETHRVLMDGGVHRVNSPNLVSSMRDHSDFTRGLAGIHTGEWDQWHHLNVFTPRYLEEMALMVGYSRVEFNERNGSVNPDVVPELRPTPGDRPEDGNVFADLIK
jgi:predicted SAM-dependent methyltransferase